MDTLRKFPRTLAVAFPAERATAGDPLVMQAISRIERAEAAPRWPFEPASAVSEFGHDDPPPRQQTVSLLQRLIRTLRRWQISRLRP